MKRGLLALAAVLTIGLVPTFGHAVPESVECGGTIAEGESGACSVEFELEKDTYLSLLGTHGNFENLLGMGEVKVRWIDAADAVVVEYTCMGLGLPDPLDDQRLLCSESSPAADSYATGVQRMEVEATADACPTGECNFEGALVFNDESDVI